MRTVLCLILCGILLMQAMPVCTAAEPGAAVTGPEITDSVPAASDPVSPVPEGTEDPELGKDETEAAVPSQETEHEETASGDILPSENSEEISYPEAIQTEAGLIILPRPDETPVPEEESPEPICQLFRMLPVEEELPINCDSFPDPAFRSYILENLDPDHSGGLSESERREVTRLALARMDIVTLQGISVFPELQYLNCQGNRLTALDVSGFCKLETLVCSDNLLSGLQLGSLPLLRTLYCSKNQLTGLNLAGLPMLKELVCTDLPMKMLNVSGNPELQVLDCSRCQLTGMDLTTAANLIFVTCQDNCRTVSGASVPVAELGTEFRAENVTDVTGGSFDRRTGLFTFKRGFTEASYTYHCGNGQFTEFHLRCEPKPLYEKIPARQPDCENPGYREHYVDSQGNPYEMVQGKMVESSIDSLALPALGHSWGRTVYTWEPDGSSCSAERACLRDPSHRESCQGTVTAEITRAPTEERMGETTYRAQFREEWAQTSGELKAEDIPRLPHSLTHVEAVAPSCESPGNLEYWQCTGCGKRFRDESAMEILEDPALPALGHRWQVSYAWQGTTCTATRTCGRNPDHRETVTAAGHGTCIRQPDCLTPGETAYRAEFSADWAEPQTLVRKDIPALDHSWGETAYHWAEDGSVCSAERICTRNPGHREQANGEITEKVTLAPTETAWGETTYQAVFREGWAEEPPALTLKNLKPLPHVHQIEKIPGREPTCLEEGKKACYRCTVCGKYFEDSGACREIRVPDNWGILPGGHVLVHNPGEEPNCTDEGILEHWYCRRCGKSFGDPRAEQLLGDLRIPPLEHIWEIRYAWEGLTCRAERICSRNPSHRDQETVTATAWTSQEATCCDWGETTYTAVFKALWAESQSFRETDLPPLGHSWGDPVYRWSPDGKVCAAQRTCLWDSSHSERVLAVSSHKVAREPEPGKPGTTAYTAVFDAGWAQPQTCVLRDIRALPKAEKAPEPQTDPTAPIAVQAIPEPRAEGIITERDAGLLRRGICAGILILSGAGLFLAVLWKHRREENKEKECKQ